MITQIEAKTSGKCADIYMSCYACKYNAEKNKKILSMCIYDEVLSNKKCPDCIGTISISSTKDSCVAKFVDDSTVSLDHSLSSKNNMPKKRGRKKKNDG